MDDKTVTSIGTAHVRNIILSLVQLFLQSVLWVFFSEPFDHCLANFPEKHGFTATIQNQHILPLWIPFPSKIVVSMISIGHRRAEFFPLVYGAKTFISTPNFRDLTLRITCMFMVHVMFWTQTDQMRSRRFVNGISGAVVMARSIWTVMLVSVNKAMFHQSSCTISSTYAFD